MRRVESTVIAAGRPPRRPGGPLNQPVVLASSFHAGGEAGGERNYAREGTPTTEAFEDAVGQLEGGPAVAFASGLAACAAILEELPTGSVVVAPRGPYFGVGDLLRQRARLGRLVHRPADLADASGLAAVVDGADLVWVESPTNPLLEVTDVAQVVAAARRVGARVAVDNTFCTPLLQRPIELGADLVVHSATKFLGGHADLLMGVAVAGDPDAARQLRAGRERYGTSPGALEAYLGLRGLRTLAVRLQRAQENAAELAARLCTHPTVDRVRYPGLPDHPGFALATAQLGGPGAILSFEVRGGAQAAERVCRSTRLIVHATSLGGVETLIERRGRYPSELDQGTPQNLVRLAVGIEHVEDLWEDLDQALRARRWP